MKNNSIIVKKLPRKKKKYIKKITRKEKKFLAQSENEPEDISIVISNNFEIKTEQKNTPLVDEKKPSSNVSLRAFSSFKFHIFAILIVVCVTLLAYSNTFQSPFYLDDDHNILSNPHVQIESLSFPELSQAAYKSPLKWRWLPNISFAVNYYFNKHNVWGYHLVNLIVHILTGITLYFLVNIVLSKSAQTRPHVSSKEIALATALIWILHPVQTNAVTYIVQRMTSMATLFFLLSVLCYIYGRHKQQTFAKLSLLFTLSLLFGFIAIFSKENALILPLMLIGYEIFFIQEKNFLYNFKKNVLLTVATFALIIFLGYIFVGGNLLGILDGYALREFSLTERLMTETRVIFHYISLLIFPLPQRLNLDYDFLISTSIFNPAQTILACIGIVIFCSMPVIFFRKNRLIAFAIFWFLGNLIIESTIIPLELIFEHRLYLPSTLLFMGLVASLYKTPFLKLKITRIIIIIILIFFGVFTWQRNMTWQTTISLWEDIVSKSPNKARGYINLGLAYDYDGQTEKGIEYYKKAEKMANKSSDLSDLSDMYRNLGWVYIKKGDMIAAISALEKGVTLNPKDPKIHLNLGIAYKKINKMEKANFHFKYARKLNSKMFAPIH